MKQLPQVLAQKERPHLIILDLGLPAGDGFAVLKQLARVSGAVGNPGDCAYGSRPRGQRKTSLASGAIAFFQKPADNDELLGVIRASLQAGMGRGGDLPS
jgi:DNA-binding response OmpR family regulator